MSRSNFNNAVVSLLVPLPSILFYLYFVNHLQTNNGGASLSPLWSWCFHHPLLLANVLFFFNVNVLFWVIGHIQSSNWVSEFFQLLVLFLLKISIFVMGFSFAGFSDDWFVLDGDTGDVSLLLCNTPIGSIWFMEIEGCDDVDMGLEYQVDS